MWNLKLAAAAGIASIMFAAGTAWYGYSSGKQSGMLEVQTLWDSEKLAMQQTQSEELMKARQREQALQALIDRQRRAHREEVNRIAAEYAALADSLRDRPDRPADGAGGVPESPDAGAGSAPRCTGAELYRQDSEFLAREAARADQLRIALNACIAHAAEVERQLNQD